MTDREIALSVLCRMDADKSYSNLTLSVYLEQCEEKNSRAFISRLVYGTLERIFTIDYYISKFSKTSVPKLDLYIRYILRLAVYQIFYLDRVPDSAACNESVELAKKYAVSFSGYVNAVLRSMIRQKDEIELPEVKFSKELSIVCSVSQSIAQLFIKQYGLERAKSILSSFFDCDDTHFCVNTTKISAKDFFESIKNVAHIRKTLIESVFAVTDSGKITEIPGFSNGYFYIQDMAAYLCAYVSGVLPGNNVLDLCAAPGGKAFTCAVNMKNSGHVDAYDINATRTKLIADGAYRLGLSIISPKNGDALVFNNDLKEKYDVVLCDVPCSGLGIMGKKPEIRCKEVRDFSGLPKIQLGILKNGAAYVKTGGVLLYSTCTLNKAENDAVVDAFLSNSDFKIADLWQDMPPFIKEKRDKSYAVTLYPDIHHTDGFFMAKFVKK